MLRPLRQVILRNFGAKIASLALALGVYAHVFSQQVRTADFEIPLTISGLPAGLTCRDDLPTKARVRIRAKGSELWKLRSQEPSVVIRLNGVKVGHLERAVTNADVVLPSQVDAGVVEVLEPTVLSLQMESVVKRGRAVAVTTRGLPAPGFVRYGAARVWPDTLVLAGPESLLEGVDSVRTEEVDLDGRSESVGQSVRVRLPEGLTAATEHVSVRIPIARLVRRSFGPLPIGIAPELRGHWVPSPGSVSVTVSGPQPAVESLGRADVRARAVVSALPETGEAAAIEVAMPQRIRPYVHVDAVDPSSVVLVRSER